MNFCPVESDLNRYLTDMDRGPSFEDFCRDNPLGDFMDDAAKSLIHDDDQHHRLAEDHGSAVMRLMLRKHHHADGLDSSYDTDQRVLDEAVINHWLGCVVEQRAIELQRKAWERS
jgi:hypothetical protein